MLNPPKYAEFFCGGGMVRAALKSQWDCALANDIDRMKAHVYEANWGKDGLVVSDVCDIPDGILRQPIDLYWASSPCQDFSLAGKGRGLNGQRSGVFRSWIQKITPAVQDGFAPSIIAFENVSGLISRRNGQDFEEVLRSLIDLGYNVGALEIDARHYVPQSRPRLFVIALHKSVAPMSLCDARPTSVYHTKRLRSFIATAPRRIKQSWCWWRIDLPTRRVPELQSLIEVDTGLEWLSPAEVDRLVSLMSDPSRHRLEAAQQSGRIEIGTLYKRGRPDAHGRTRQRAEIRFDGLAGCLRTPSGGSSRQTLVVVEGAAVKARLLSSREAVRLMGLADSYVIPDNYNSAYKVAGDGVVVPLVRHLDAAIFQPALKIAQKSSKAA
ncbi:DNA cytosine methyltransferase [Marivita sp. S0852]|uniref:DNA cytosine methyltransferase n=1 Tax=Marivita sp. S0852 TaxID=3373893 RepID=UPI003981DC6B